MFISNLLICLNYFRKCKHISYVFKFKIIKKGRARAPRRNRSRGPDKTVYSTPPTPPDTIGHGGWGPPSTCPAATPEGYKGQASWVQVF